MQIKEFLSKLSWLRIPQEWDKETAKEIIAEIKKRMAAIKLTEPELQRLFDHLYEHCEWFPSWKQIREAMLELDMIEGEKRYAVKWEFFERDGKRYARKIETVRIPKHTS
jgi:hypothetical protein